MILSIKDHQLQIKRCNPCYIEVIIRELLSRSQEHSQTDESSNLALQNKI